jgi:hypothetical protein
MQQLWQTVPVGRTSRRREQTRRSERVEIRRGTNTGKQRAPPPATHRLAYAAATWERGMSMVMAMVSGTGCFWGLLTWRVDGFTDAR